MFSHAKFEEVKKDFKERKKRLGQQESFGSFGSLGSFVSVDYESSGSDGRACLGRENSGSDGRAFYSPASSLGDFSLVSDGRNTPSPEKEQADATEALAARAHLAVCHENEAAKASPRNDAVDSSSTKALDRDAHLALAARELGNAAVDLTNALRVEGGNAAAAAASCTGDTASPTTATRWRFALLFAIVGATFCSFCGAIVGGFFGLIVGLLFAIFTFGFSIPVGIFIGCCLGASLGASVGATFGALLGCIAFAYRKELQSLAQAAFTCFRDSAQFLQAKAQHSANHVSEAFRSMIPAGGCTGGTSGKEQ